MLEGFVHRGQNVAAGLASAILFAILHAVWYLTPVLDYVSINAWVCVGVLVALIFGAMCRTWISSPLQIAAGLVAGTLLAGTWTEATHGQHDTLGSTTWLYAFKHSVPKLWSYDSLLLVAALAGWIAAGLRSPRGKIKA